MDTDFTPAEVERARRNLRTLQLWSTASTGWNRPITVRERLAQALVVARIRGREPQTDINWRVT